MRSLWIIGFYFKRMREIAVLKSRFEMRKRTLQAIKDLEAERLRAEEERLQTIEEMKRNEENMKATIAAAWKQGSDASGRNYFYNYVTGESRCALQVMQIICFEGSCAGGHRRRIGR